MKYMRRGIAFGIVGIALFLGMAQPCSAHLGWGIVIDSQDRLYFTDITNRTIWRLLPDGTLEAVATGVWTHHLFLDSQDNVYFESEEYRGNVGPYNSLWKLSPSGVRTEIIAPTLNREDFGGEYTVVDDQSNIYFREGNRIIKRLPSGALELLAGGDTAGRQDGQGKQALFGWITAMTMGPDGAIYVIDDDALRKVTLDGMVTTLAEGLLTEPPDDPFFADGSFNIIWDLAMDAEGNAYLAYNGNRRLLRLTPGGELTELYHTTAPWSPMGVTVKDGITYLLEVAFVEGTGHAGPRVRRLLQDGTSRILVSMAEGDTKGETPEPASEESIGLLNTPNPFNETTTISYQLAEAASVQLSIFDTSGRVIRRWKLGRQKIGANRVVWNGVDEAGRRVGSGAYHCQLRVGQRVYSHTMILTR